MLSAVATLWFSAISVDTSYWLQFAPAMLVLALGFGLGVMALTQAAIYDIDPDEAGIASALVNSAQQIGVALGLAVLAGVAATVTNSADHADTATALVDGYRAGLIVATGILLAAGALALATLSSRRVETDVQVAATAGV